MPKQLVFVYAALCAVLLPLYMNKGLWDVADAKFIWFLLHTAVLGAAVCLCLPANKPALALRSRWQGWHGWLLALVAGGAVSCLMAAWPGSFWGAPGRDMGLAMLLAGGLCVFAVARWYPSWGRVAGCALLVGGSLPVSALAVAQFFGAAPLNVFEGGLLITGEYMAPLGNVNTLAAYQCLILPLAGAGFVVWKARPLRVLCAAAGLLGWAAMLCSNSDGALVGVALAGLVALLLPGLTVAALQRGVAFIGVCLAAGSLAGLRDLLRLNNTYLHSGPSALLARPDVALGLGALCGLGWLLLRLGVRRGWFTGNTCVQKPARAAALALACCGGLGFAAANLGAPVPENLRRLVVFNENWGAGRAVLWRDLWTQFWAQPPWRWLLGTGPDHIRRLLEGTPAYVSFLVHGFYPDAAHNEYLQVLAGQGLLGLAALLGLGACAARRLWQPLQAGTASPVAAGLLLALAAYAGQALFGVAAPGTAALVCLMAGLALAEGRQDGPAPLPARPRRAEWLLLRLAGVLAAEAALLAITGPLAGWFGGARPG